MKTLTVYATEAMKEYADATNMRRTLPNVVDGLKPVQRRIMWTMYGLGATSNRTKPIKSARIVGDVIGKYHPHGDEACYKALVGLVNQPCNPAYGEGNWGGIDDKAAAMRYTNAKLSEYGDSFFNSAYIQVTSLVPNYDGTLTEPFILPSRLPNLLLNGGSGVGVGVTTEFPSFTKSSVEKMVAKVIAARIKGTVVPSKVFASTLEFTTPTGGIIPSSEYQSVLKYMETGIAALTWKSILVDEGTQLRCEAFAQVSLIEAFAKIREIPAVSDVYEIETPGDLKKVTFIISFKKRQATAALIQAKDAITKILSVRVHYKANAIQTKLYKGNS